MSLPYLIYSAITSPEQKFQDQVEFYKNRYLIVCHEDGAELTKILHTLEYSISSEGEPQITIHTIPDDGKPFTVSEARFLERNSEIPHKLIVMSIHDYNTRQSSP
jgi:hypothetical protein